jgi:hypothetical protein
VALGAVGIIALAGTLGGLTGVFAGLGAATAVAVEGVKALDMWLHKTFGGIIGSSADVEKTQKSMKEHGVVLPWWAPLPAFGGVTREERPGWAKWSDWLGTTPANGSTASAPGASKPSAPMASTMPSGPKGTQEDPFIVHVQNQPTGDDLARGVAGNIAGKMNRAPSGYTGSDMRIDPLQGFYGMVSP